LQESRRQKRVSNVIREELSRLFIESIQDATSSLITITRVSMSKDLKAAYIHLSILGGSPKEDILEMINSRIGYFRKVIASKTKLKYNPMLFFSLDERFDIEARIDEVIKKLKNNEK
jgi:ribosome-binding factor A